MSATLASRLNKRMIDRGYNRKSLSEAAGLNETAVRDIMNGRARRPLYTTIIALADVLGCTPGDLVEGWRPSERDELRQALKKITEMPDVDGTVTLTRQDIADIQATLAQP